MKNWMVLAMIASGLFYALWYWPRQEPKAPDNPAAVTPLTENRSLPYQLPTLSPEPQPLKFDDYPCARDCSTHRAGFDWARANNITDPDSCIGDSAEFIEGCRVYARQHAAILRND